MGYYMAGGYYRAGGHTANATPPSDSSPSRTYRRTNPGNIHALRRAMRRVQSFAKLAHKTISFTHRVKMKKHRRR
jgi:hypothetical protein